MAKHADIILPDFCLVLLIGPEGAGKTRFAEKHFAAEEVISLRDHIPPGRDEHLSREEIEAALAAMLMRAETRLRARKLTVINAENIKPGERGPFASLAQKYFAKTVGFVFNFTADNDPAQFRLRPGSVRDQLESLRKTLKDLQGRKSVKEVHKFRSPDEADAITRIARHPLPVDFSDTYGPFDIIGDVHGCAGELETLLESLGYTLRPHGKEGQRSYEVRPPEGRRAIFVGDLVDRGPRSPDVLRLVASMVEAGTGFCVIGNHEFRLKRKLTGDNVRAAHGLQQTLDQMGTQPRGFRTDVLDFIDSLPSHMVLEGGRLVVAHAGLKEDMHNRTGGKVRSFAMYGDTTGERDAYGFPVRLDWAAKYNGDAAVVYGHTPVKEAVWKNNTICIDTACVYGGKLTALRWPERELVSVPAEKVWFEAKKPIV